MTLSEFFDKASYTPGSNTFVKVMVFIDEDSADSYIDDLLNGADNHDYEILCCLYGSFKASSYLKDEIACSNILQVYAIDRDFFAVVIDLESYKNKLKELEGIQ